MESGTAEGSDGQVGASPSDTQLALKTDGSSLVLPRAKPQSKAVAAIPPAQDKEGQGASGKILGSAATKPAIPHSGFVVQLASIKSRSSAASELDRLQGNYAHILGEKKLTLIAADLGDRGIFYRVRSQPFQTPEEAKNLCQALKAADQPCLVMKTGK